MMSLTGFETEIIWNFTYEALYLYINRDLEWDSAMTIYSRPTFFDLGQWLVLSLSIWLQQITTIDLIKWDDLSCWKIDTI